MASSRNVVILLGPPGAGKGTQAKAVMDELSLPQISTGDILRDAISRGTPLGMQAKKLVDAGELVSDDIVNGVVTERIQEPDCAHGFILDGYPRNVAQAKAFDGNLDSSDRLSVIELGVDTERLVQRLTARRTCSKCKAIYNLESRPPEKAGVCDKCGGELVQRSDDTEAVVRDRLGVYRKETEPLVAYYKEQDVYQQLDGMAAIDEVTENLVTIIRRSAAA